MNKRAPEVSKMEIFKKAVVNTQEERIDMLSKLQEQNKYLLDELEGGDLKASEKVMLEAICAAKINEFLRSHRSEFTTDDFKALKIVGAGAFGIVRIVQHKESGEMFALKSMPKNRMTRKNQRDRVMSERELLSGFNSDEARHWVVGLHATFQDPKYLYMLMEYLPGGDLHEHLDRLNVMTESCAKFYAAELCIAVNAVHKRGYTHRDLKPDNIVLTSEGHLKLLDFGLCTADPSLSFEAQGLVNGETNPSEGGAPPKEGTRTRPTRKMLHSLVGTPVYMAPELLSGKYDHAADWWSVGVIIYEMLTGHAPFWSSERDTDKLIRRITEKIRDHKKYLLIPFPNVPMSATAQSLLRGLLTDSKSRLTFDQIKSHPFFDGIQWSTLHLRQAMIKPQIPDLSRRLKATSAQLAKEKPFIDVDGKAVSLALPSYSPMGADKDGNLEYQGYTYNANTGAVPNVADLKEAAKKLIK